MEIKSNNFKLLLNPKGKLQVEIFAIKANEINLNYSAKINLLLKIVGHTKNFWRNTYKKVAFCLKLTKSSYDQVRAKFTPNLSITKTLFWRKRGGWADNAVKKRQTPKMRPIRRCRRP